MQKFSSFGQKKTCLKSHLGHLCAQPFNYCNLSTFVAAFCLGSITYDMEPLIKFCTMSKFYSLGSLILRSLNVKGFPRKLMD